MKQDQTAFIHLESFEDSWYVLSKDGRGKPLEFLQPANAAEPDPTLRLTRRKEEGERREEKVKKE
ncbi:hypothetical protein TESG_08423 [Trichophyton tonsurans CBS 112818]|uniref:Uncharacterized protein n=1 Tax=Trichophyton tonsurans (strain CBS 112818) TaxID=647933 RepID=F2RXS6_TRIT1|nr:hypothetical protein TESG_08423 [Trichophyton tonsurans CBS 112818]